MTDEANAILRIQATMQDIIGKDLEHIERRTLSLIGAVGSHRIVYVHDGQDAGKATDLLLLQSRRVARSVVPLVMLQHSADDLLVRSERRVGEQLLPQGRMLLH